jgi:hypothetical protein
MTTEDLTWFQNLSTPEVAAIVRERGPRTVVFAAGGTTRWYILNCLDGWPKDMSYWQGYRRQSGQRILNIARMFFNHGVHTLFTHALTPGQFDADKGEGYLPLALTSGMERIAGTSEFLQFYEEYGVRVRFFGNYRQVLEGSQYRGTLALFDEAEERTRTNDRCRLYWGFNSEQDQIAPILELAVQYYRNHGRAPSREEVVELYYGEPVEPLDIFIGFNRPRIAALMPPLLESRADLYFTVGLSWDLSQLQLRNILYDHLYARRGRHRDYGALPASAFSEMQAFYRLNQGGVIGLGRRYEPGNIWHPIPQVHLPSGWDEEDV